MAATPTTRGIKRFAEVAVHVDAAYPSSFGRMRHYSSAH